jgi:hypothetical protein
MTPEFMVSFCLATTDYLRSNPFLTVSRKAQRSNLTSQPSRSSVGSGLESDRKN